MVTEAIERNFKFHEVGAEQQTRIDRFRAACKELASAVDDCVPPGREQSVAITNLEQVMFWGTAGISRQKY